MFLEISPPSLVPFGTFLGAPGSFIKVINHHQKGTLTILRLLGCQECDNSDHDGKREACSSSQRWYELYEGSQAVYIYIYVSPKPRSVGSLGFRVSG